MPLSIPHGCDAYRVRLDGDSGKLWAFITSNGGKFFAKKLSRRLAMGWPSIAAMRRGESVVGAGTLTRTMELLDQYSSQQGSIVTLKPETDPMQEDTTQDIANNVLKQSGRDIRELLKRKEIPAEKRDVLRHAQSILEDTAAPGTVPFFDFEATAA